MEHLSRPAPVVTVRDPARPHAPADLLDSGPEPAPVLTGRRVAAALATAAVLAGVLGVVELREQRALAAEERRLATAVSLSLPDGTSSGGASFSGGGGELQARLLVRNDGPRDVELVGARTSGLALRQASVPLPAGQARQLDLLQPFTCGQERPAPLQAGPLQVDVRTGAGTTSTVQLPLQLPFRVDEAARMCGWVPLQEAVFVGVREGRQSEGVLRLDVDVSNVSRFPVEVVGLATAPGLSSRLLQPGGGAEVPLPATLPAAEGSWVSLLHVVELRVADCAVARGQVRVTIGLAVRDQDGGTAQAVTDYGPRLMSELLSASCP